MGKTIKDDQRKQIFALKGKIGADGKPLSARAVAAMVSRDGAEVHYSTVSRLWNQEGNATGPRARAKEGDATSDATNATPNATNATPSLDIYHIRDDESLEALRDYYTTREAVLNELIHSLVNIKKHINGVNVQVVSDPQNMDYRKTITQLEKAKLDNLNKLSVMCGFDKASPSTTSEEDDLDDFVSLYSSAEAESH